MRFRGLQALKAQVGAAALQQLLHYEEPPRDQRTPPCPCAQQARYLELRAKRLVSVLGEVELSRPYYLCEPCGEGQFPVDQQLDVEQTKNTPGVRRMLALVGHQAAFQRGKEQMKILAGLEVTTKAAERTAEAIGEAIVQREQEEMARALQLDLPEMVGLPIPVLYVEMDGTGVPW